MESIPADRRVYVWAFVLKKKSEASVAQEQGFFKNF